MALDVSARHSRRALLFGAAGGMAALAAQAIGRPAPTRATHSGAVQLGHSNTTAGTTQIINTTLGSTALRGDGSGSGTGVWGSTGSGTGVYGKGGEGTGVRGDSEEHIGVEGVGFTGAAIGIRGQAMGSGTSVVGLKEGPGIAVAAAIVDPASSSSAVDAFTGGTGAGIYSESTKGRGGRFKGKKAQIRLDPSTAATHPASGAAGDIFLDASKRLWLCKGGTTWVRIV